MMPKKRLTKTRAKAIEDRYINSALAKAIRKIDSLKISPDEKELVQSILIDLKVKGLLSISIVEAIEQTALENAGGILNGLR